MTTTAFDDQFTAEPEHVAHRPYDTAAILRQNVADLERELQRQRERADRAETELKAAREQKPVAWADGDGGFYAGRHYPNAWPTAIPLYTRPVPAAPRKYQEFTSVMLDAQPFITAETYGGRYIVAMRFERLGEMQDCHAALLALLQSGGGR